MLKIEKSTDFMLHYKICIIEYVKFIIFVNYKPHNMKYINSSLIKDEKIIKEYKNEAKRRAEHSTHNEKDTFIAMIERIMPQEKGEEE